MLKKLLTGCLMVVALVLAGCGGDSEEATVKGRYTGDVNFVVAGVGSITGPVVLVIEDNYKVSGNWTAFQTPPGAYALVSFVGTSTSGGSVTAIGYNGPTDVMRIVGSADAVTGLFSGTFTLTASGRTGTMTLTRQ